MSGLKYCLGLHGPASPTPVFGALLPDGNGVVRGEHTKVALPRSTVMLLQEIGQVRDGKAQEGGVRDAWRRPDWEKLRAVDILVVLRSFLRKGSRIERVTVYPSDFGLQRMEEEAALGPQASTCARGSCVCAPSAGPIFHFCMSSRTLLVSAEIPGWTCSTGAARGRMPASWAETQAPLNHCIAGAVHRASMQPEPGCQGRGQPRTGSRIRTVPHVRSMRMGRWAIRG
jgi:hypothetical protein